MAAPNIINVSLITGKTAVANVTTTAAAIVNNAAASNKVFKINSLYISNVDGTASADINVEIQRSSVSYHIAKTIVVPADATLDVVNKPLYLEEGDSLRLVASSNSYLQAVCSYEELS